MTNSFKSMVLNCTPWPFTVHSPPLSCFINSCTPLPGRKLKFLWFLTSTKITTKCSRLVLTGTIHVPSVPASLTVILVRLPFYLGHWFFNYHFQESTFNRLPINQFECDFFLYFSRWFFLFDWYRSQDPIYSVPLFQFWPKALLLHWKLRNCMNYFILFPVK